MKILVTGGAGFIGGNFIRFTRNKYPNYKIVCVDLLTYAGNLETLADMLGMSNFKFEKADISNAKDIDRIFNAERPDIAVNFAAESHVDRSIEDPGLFLKTNILGTQTLMDACIKYNVKRFHQVSTDEVYGDLPIDKPELLFTENSPIHASSPYSASKASADLLCLAYQRTFALPATISRCSNNYGPFHFPEKLIPLVISRALNDQSIPVYGEGKNIRDWLYVEDHCSAIDKIIHEAKNGDVYNIGGGCEKQNIDVVKLILKILNKPESLITYVKDRPGHDLRYAIDYSKIKTELGWTPSVKFEEGLKKTVDWYLTNKDWWQNIISGEYKNYYQKMYSGRETAR